MGNDIWQLQEAKNRFSEVINKALSDGPQTVTRHGEEIVVILSKAEYNRLLKSQLGLLEFFQQSPLVGVELDLERDNSLPRDVDL
jgi:prevent-host-death family protein